MIPPSLLFSLLGVSELALSIFKRAGTRTQDQDRGTLRLLWIVILASITGAIVISKHLQVFSVPCHEVMMWCATTVFILGLLLRWWAIVHLGRFFTVNVAIAADHRVVHDGPYRFLRHPSYTGLLMAFLALGTMLCNWLALLTLMMPVTMLLLRRIHVEERALSRALGTAYVEYMARTWRLVPFVY